MRKKRLLSYEAKIILFITLIALLIYFSFDFFNNIIFYEEKVENFYDIYIGIYPIWAQISVIFIPFVIYTIIYLIRKNWSDYKSDTIYDINWTWTWSKDKIVNLQCTCPTCGENLYYDIVNSTKDHIKIGKMNFICGKCNKIVGSIPNTNVTTRASAIIKKEIERVIRKRMLNK